MATNQKNFKVYKSSAGSGKTFTLSKTYLKIVLSNPNPNYFKHILAITFTVKAAAEMKERIVSYLSALAGNSNQRKDLDFMQSALTAETGLNVSEIAARSKLVLQTLIHNYGDFSILTIDKFVHRLVRSFASDLGFSSDFEVEIDQSRIIALATNAILERVGEDQNITKLILAYTENQTEIDKSWNIEPELAKLAEQLSSEDFFIHGNVIQNIRYENALDIIKELKREVDAFEKKVKAIYVQSQKILIDNGLEYADFKYGSKGFHSFFNKFEHLDSYLKQPLPSNQAQKLATSADAGSPKSPHKKTADAVMPQYNQLLSDALVLFEKTPEIKLKKLLQHELFSIALINEISALLVEIKAEENVQTLSDFNQVITKNFLGEQTPFIYEKLGNRYHHILIDEFQDTSVLQWNNLLPLVENNLASGYENLIVGDIKQSIYRFRGSEPSQFSDLPKVPHSSSPLFEASYDAQVLNTNFRSAKNIVLFNNKFFKQLIQTIVNEQNQFIYHDLSQKINSNETGEVLLQFIDKNEDNPASEILFNAMLNRIFELKKIDETNLGKTCVLFRTNDAASQFASVLLKNQINVVSEESLLIQNNINVQVILATLMAARYSNDNFYQQYLCAKLAQCKLIGKDHHSITKAISDQKLDFNGLMKITAIPVKLSDLEQGDSFSKIYLLCKVFHFKPNNPYLLRLLDFAWDFEQKNLYLKHSFLEYFESEKSKLSVQLPSTGNAVRVMTIHKSKGLEFKNVLIYLPEFSKGKPTKKFAIVHDKNVHRELHDFILPIDKLEGTPFEQIKDDEDEKSLLDFLNTIYVAFTRAEHSLSIYAFSSGGGKNSPIDFILKWPEYDSIQKKLLLNHAIADNWV